MALRLVREGNGESSRSKRCSFCSVADPKKGRWWSVSGTANICDECVERMFFVLFEVYRKKFRKQ